MSRIRLGLRVLLTMTQHEGETPPRKMAKMRCACGHNYKKISELVYHLEKGTRNSGTDETEVDKTALLPTKFESTPQLTRTAGGCTGARFARGSSTRCPKCSDMSRMARAVSRV